MMYIKSWAMLCLLVVLAACGRVETIRMPRFVVIPIPPKHPSTQAAPRFMPAPTFYESAPSNPRTPWNASPPAMQTPQREVVSLENVTGYIAHRVITGETLAMLAERGGSDVDLIRAYNHLSQEPQIGRELIIPQLAGRTSSYESQQLIVEHGNTKNKWIAFTFDCGGQNDGGPQIVATLKKYGIKTTFFILGDSIIHNPDLLRQMVADGHEIGHHSYTHRSFRDLSEAEIAEEMTKTEDVIHEIAGDDVLVRPFFRFPYGEYTGTNQRTIISMGYLPIHWTLDSRDSYGTELTTPEEIKTRLTTILTDEQLPGAILLAHCVERTASVLPDVIEYYHAKGYEFRPLSDVLER